MEFDLIINPLFQIFKHNEAGIITEEIEDPTKFPLLYNYIFENSNKKIAINIINILKEILKRQRSISAFFPKYNNKSIYIFLFELFLKEKNNPQLRKGIFELLSEINVNIQISKEEYDFIFQKFSKLYLKDDNFLLDIKKYKYSFDEYYTSLFELLNETLPNNLNDKIYPSNYFACFGKNSFNLNFNRNKLTIGNCFSFILNFKISKSKLMEKNSEVFNKCNLIKINFINNKKNISIELKYPNILNIIDDKKEIKVKILPLGEWINLFITLTEQNGIISSYFCLNEENLQNPIQLSNIKLNKEDKINSISFFDNFYGEVTSIIILSLNQTDWFNILFKNIKIFTEIKKGLWNKWSVFNFIRNAKDIVNSDKKRDKGGGGVNTGEDLIGIFTPINYDSSHPNIIEDSFGKFYLEMNGNIRNNKYFPFIKNLNQICSINNFLPLVEMFIIYQKEILNNKNFLEYFKMISKIVKEINNVIVMNKINFFKILGLYLEQIPNEYFNEDIINEFENISNIILSQNIKDIKSDFFTEILLNEKIIFKYNINLRSIFWNKFLQLYLSNKENMKNYLDIQNLCSILLHYDELTHTEMCCEFHLNMYKKDFIGNMKTIQPNFDYQLLSLKMIINEYCLSQNFENIIPLIELLILDISPCLAKLIIGILINFLNRKEKDETSKNNIVLELMNIKYITILMNLFVNSLPDVRYEILILISSIDTLLLKQNNSDKFLTLVKMLKTCLLPISNIKDSNTTNASINTNQKDKAKLNEDIQNLKENLTLKQENIKPVENIIKKEKSEIVPIKTIVNNNANNKSKTKINETQIINQPEQTKKSNEKKISSKPNSVLSLAGMFESKNRIIQNTIIKPNTKKLDDTKIKNLEQKEQNNKSQFQQIKEQLNNQLKKINNDNQKDFGKVSKDNLNNTNKTKIENKNKTNIENTKNVINTQKCNKELLIKKEIYDLYINHLYNFLIQWSLGTQPKKSSSKFKELFSLSKKEKEIENKTKKLILNMNIIDIIFTLNKNLDDINFTLRFLKDIEQLIELEENSNNIVNKNYKIYSSLLDIIFKYYQDKNKNTKETEIYNKGKKICFDIFIKVLKYQKKINKKLPMKKLEILFLWGDFIMNNSKKEEIIYDFIRDFLYELTLKIKNEFNEINSFFKFNFENEQEIIDNYFFKNYIINISFIYNFCILYKSELVIKNSDIESFNPNSSSIFIPEIFLSGMRKDENKINNIKNIKEYWKDYSLIELILNDIEYIFQYRYVKNKIYKNKSSIKEKPKENKVIAKEYKYDKYNKILNDLIFNKDKRNLFSKELYILCYYNSDDNYFIPLLKIISMTYICIISVVKNIDDKELFMLWLNKYKNLLRFLLLATININKDKKNSEFFDKIQNYCLDVICSGLCFLNNLYDTCIFFTEEIKKVITNIFLLCFSILNIYLNKKLFVNNKDIYTYPNALLILFNDYIKDENKNPFITLTKLEKIYLNPSKNICDLIKKTDFVEKFFCNKNIKNKLYQNYYSLKSYKNLVEERFKFLISLTDNLDYSYQIGIYDLFTDIEKWIINLNNKRYKNNVKNRKEYKRQKQKLFTFNGMWSDRELFYKYDNNDIIKYKVMNHYSKNLMRPILTPIFDIKYYLPEFNDFDTNNLFLKNNSKENKTKNSYNLILDFDSIIKIPNLSKNEQNKSSNNFILRGKLYKSNQKYYDFLEKISKLINGELIEDQIQIQEEKEEASIEQEDILKKYLSSSLKTERTKKSDSLSTRFSTMKEPNKKRSSVKFNFFRFSLGGGKEKEKEKIKTKQDEFNTDNKYTFCCLVKQTHHIKGLLCIKETKINFKKNLGKKLDNKTWLELNEKNNDNFDHERGDCFGSYFKEYKKDKNFYKLNIKYDEIKMIFKKKYYYKNSAIEIYTANNKSYFFNFSCQKIMEIFLDEILNKLGEYSNIINDMKEKNNKEEQDNIIGYLNNKHISILNKNESKKNTPIKLSKLVKLWKSWEISNFEFLMYLNIFSNRSYIDISQYPIFPWLLTNYEDPLLKDQKDNISEKAYSYRDLSLPMGMLKINENSDNRIKNFCSTFRISKGDPNINNAYFYGCNYSNSTYICNYLIRLFPYTQACIELQGNGFDNPRRLFCSINNTFKNASTQTTDIRELIPEFFYLPEMFLNLNKLNLGDETTEINDVYTPCGNNPYEFTMIMKNILESKNVSNELNGWIDLIFGIKAKDEGAELANNVFTEQAYQEDINLEEVEDKVSTLRYIEFGLIPNQLFNNKEFDKREKLDIVKKYKQITDSNNNLKYFKCKKNLNNIMQLNEQILIGIKYISNDKTLFVYNNGLIIEKKITCSIKECSEEIISKKQKNFDGNKIGYNCIPYIQDSKNIKIIRDGKIIIVSGFYDGKILVIQNDLENIPIYPFREESSIITTINVDFEEKYLFIGNNIGNISIISIESNDINNWKEIHFINDQLSIINSIETNYQLNIWASSTIDGYINIYTLPQCKLTKSFKIEYDLCNNIFICDSPLPSILIICQEEVLLYSINGNKIYYQKEYSKIINPIVIKDFIKKDFLAYITNGNEIHIRNVSDFTLISSIKIDSEIFYLFPNDNCRVLYATNQSGTEINAVFIK